MEIFVMMICSVIMLVEVILSLAKRQAHQRAAFGLTAVFIGAFLFRLQNNTALAIFLVWALLSTATLLLMPNHEKKAASTRDSEPVEKAKKRIEVYAEAFNLASGEEYSLPEAAAIAFAQDALSQYKPPAKGPWSCRSIVPLFRIPILGTKITYYDNGILETWGPFSEDPTFLGGIKEIRFNGWIYKIIGVGFVEVVYKRIEEGSEKTLSRKISVPLWFLNEHKEEMKLKGYNIK